MYATEIDGQVLNLAVSGKLWRRSLIMIDEETRSLWSQMLGRAMEGKLKDKTLQILPSALTDWASWKKNYPETSVIRLSRTGQEFRKNFYKSPEKFVIGVYLYGKAKAWPFDQLMKQEIVNDVFAGRPVAVYFKPDSAAAYIYDRMLEGEELEFEYVGTNILDKTSKSTWDLATGKCLKGPHEGSRLKPVPAIPSFRKSWITFHPTSEIWSNK